jgi:hypothetical protein
MRDASEDVEARPLNGADTRERDSDNSVRTVCLPTLKPSNIQPSNLQPYTPQIPQIPTQVAMARSTCRGAPIRRKSVKR